MITIKRLTLAFLTLLAADAASAGPITSVCFSLTCTQTKALSMGLTLTSDPLTGHQDVFSIDSQAVQSGESVYGAGRFGYTTQGLLTRARLELEDREAWHDEYSLMSGEAFNLWGADFDTEVFNRGNGVCFEFLLLSGTRVDAGCFNDEPYFTTHLSFVLDMPAIGVVMSTSTGPLEYPAMETLHVKNMLAGVGKKTPPIPEIPEPGTFALSSVAIFFLIKLRKARRNLKQKS